MSPLRPTWQTAILSHRDIYPVGPHYTQSLSFSRDLGLFSPLPFLSIVVIVETKPRWAGERNKVKLKRMAVFEESVQNTPTNRTAIKTTVKTLTLSFGNLPFLFLSPFSLTNVSQLDFREEHILLSELLVCFPYQTCWSVAEHRFNRKGEGPSCQQTLNHIDLNS